MMKILILAAVSMVGAEFLPQKAAHVGVRHAAPMLPAPMSICPAEQPKARRAVHKFLVAPGLSSFRGEIGIPSTDTTSVRLLVDSTDSAVCQRFLNELTPPAEPPSDWAFYEAGGFYFVAAAYRGDQLMLRASPLIIYDSTFTVRQVLGM